MTVHTSAQLQRIFKESHTIATRCLVIRNHKDPLQSLQIMDGNIHVNTGNKIRRTAEIKVSDPTGTLVASELTDLLHPLSGNEISLGRGAYVPDFAAEEFCQQGIFIIEDNEIIDSGEDLSISLKLVDRSFAVSRARQTEPMVISGSVSIGTQIMNVLDQRYPMGEYANDFTEVRPWMLAPQGVIDRTDDVWEICTKWATDAGLDLRFDTHGMLELKEMPSSTPGVDQVAWEYIEGATCTLLSIRKNITVDNTYNHVLCYSQPTDGTAPVHGEAMVTDIEHPLNVNGPMGDVPFFYSSNTFTSAEQCTTVAQSLLYKHLGHTEHVHFNALVNPCLEENDVVRIKRAKAGVDTYLTLDSFTVPMTGLRAMEIDARDRFILDSST